MIAETRDNRIFTRRLPVKNTRAVREICVLLNTRRVRGRRLSEWKSEEELHRLRCNPSICPERGIAGITDFLTRFGGWSVCRVQTIRLSSLQ